MQKCTTVCYCNVYTNNTCRLFSTIPNHILCSVTNCINTISFRTHELATISVQMIHSHILGIPMIGSTAMVHVVPGKWQLHVIMVFVVLVWHMTRKSLVSAWIGWIYRTINTYSNIKIRQYDVMSCVGILYFFYISIHVAYL